MPYVAKLVDVCGTAVGQFVWVSPPNAPKTLQDACLQGRITSKHRKCNKLRKGGVNRKRSRRASPLPRTIYNPRTTDYGYMRYSISLGADGHVCGWSRPDPFTIRLPELIHSPHNSRESSPTPSSSSSESPATPSSIANWSRFSLGELSFSPQTPRRPSVVPEKETKVWAIDKLRVDELYANAPDSDLSFQLSELQETLLDPFTRREIYQELR